MNLFCLFTNTAWQVCFVFYNMKHQIFMFDLAFVLWRVLLQMTFSNLHIRPTRCGLSANLRCRSETCCTRLAENTGRKKVPPNHHRGTITQICRAISSQLRHVSTIGKKC